MQVYSGIYQGMQHLYHQQLLPACPSAHIYKASTQSQTYTIPLIETIYATYTYIYKHKHMYTELQVYLCIHLYIHIRVYIYIYTYVYMYTLFWDPLELGPLVALARLLLQGVDLRGAPALREALLVPGAAQKVHVSEPLEESKQVDPPLGSDIEIDTDTNVDISSKSRATLRFYNLHHRRSRVQNWRFYLLEPPRGPLLECFYSLCLILF